MSVFKCKMCGGELDIIEGSTIAKCLYCKTKQTIPNVMDENMQNLFNRANVLRMKGEFDKAERIYEKIVQSDDTQSEAYWGIILCKYGIEYVDDPNTNEKIPTCHRASYDSIIADEDYKSAIENADSMQKGIYENQAKEIDRIQKEILALAQKEETYDVFICYKETDSNGRRTQDSVIANDIYYQLTNEGFKVFYAAITLEGKLGSAYEPIIFAALNSAKVMLVIGTDPDYFNAVWVRNEWSRYLKIIQKDRSKLLIPCYRDMVAYELPEEFAHLQAQDMSKIGFINDIVRGIKKVATQNKPKASTVIKETVIQNVNTNIDTLLKRIDLFLESKEWDSANTYCEKVLDSDPENAQAYIYKLLTQLQLSKEEDLKLCVSSIDQLTSYKMAIRFADNETLERLGQYSRIINDNIIKKETQLRIEQERRNKIAQERKKLLDKKNAISNNIKSLEKKQRALKQNYLEAQYQYKIAELKNKKVKRYAVIIFLLAFLSIVLFVVLLSVGNSNAIYGYAICYIVMMVFSGLMLQEQDKPLGWLFASFLTLGMASFIYACVSLISNKHSELSLEEELMNSAYSKLEWISNDIERSKRELSDAERDLIRFDRVNK